MQYGLVLITPPASEPVSLQEAYDWLRLDTPGAADGTVIPALVTAARQYAEDYTGRQLVSAQWKVTWDSFYEDWRLYQQPAGAVWNNTWRVLQERGTSVGILPGGIIRLPKPPCISVDAVQYTDTNGVLQTVAPSVYQTDLTKEPAWVMPAYGQVWPMARNIPGAVSVTFTAGYSGTVPESTKLAIKRHAAMMYENRATEAEMKTIHTLLELDGSYGEYR